MWILGAAVAAYVVACLGVAGVQRYAIFPGGGPPDTHPGEWGYDYEDLRLSVDGETTHAWYVPARNAKGVVLFSHGNAGHMGIRRGSIERFLNAGYSVLIYAYGGYGESTGTASEARAYADIRAAWRYLTERRGIPPERVALFGRSLGGGPTADLAAEVEPGAVILESTFTSTWRLAQDMIPILPMRFIIRHRFDNLAKIDSMDAPLLVIHGKEDNIVPYSHGRTLFEAASEPKAFFELQGVHNEGFAVTAGYAEALRRFLDETIGAN